MVTRWGSTGRMVNEPGQWSSSQSSSHPDILSFPHLVILSPPLILSSSHRADTRRPDTAIHTYLTTAPASSFAGQITWSMHGAAATTCCGSIDAGGEDAIVKLYLDAGQARAAQLDGWRPRSAWHRAALVRPLSRWAGDG